jgi:hypothetical protein
VFPFAHIFREGSSIKISVEAPGGNRTRWAFGTIPGVATNTIAHTATMPSSVVLPLVPDVEVETGLLRAGPCEASRAVRRTKPERLCRLAWPPSPGGPARRVADGITSQSVR